LRALRHRNFKLYFFGQGLSLIGTWLTRVATLWLVYYLAKLQGNTLSAAATLGIVAFVSNVPMFCVAPFAGVLVDRFNRHHVIIWTQVLSMLQSGTLAYLTISGRITIPDVVALALFQGFVDALGTPARQAFIVEMVDDPIDLANAIALQSSIFNAARLLGPAIGGLLLTRFTPGACFAVDSCSYVAVIIGLLMMRLKPRPPRATKTHVIADLKEGIRYTFGFAPLRSILVLVAGISFCASALGTLMPIIAAQMRGGPNDAAKFGFLMASIGVGALAGAIYLAARRTVVGLSRVMCIAALLLAVAMSCIVSVHHFYLAVPLCMIAGCGQVTLFASGNTMLQTITEDTMRGRVMSFFAMLVVGVSPFGALLAGYLATPERLGPALLIHIYAFLALLNVMYFIRKLPALRPLVRPIYVKKGIIPEVAMGLALDAQEER
jgi:MFS family permease